MCNLQFVCLIGVVSGRRVVHGSWGVWVCIVESVSQGCCVGAVSLVKPSLGLELEAVVRLYR